MSDDLHQLLASLPPEEQEALILQARQDCWRNGDLTYKLHEGWQEIWADIESRPDVTRWVLEISRKWGKTFFLVTMCAMFCLRFRGIRIPYGAPTVKHLEEFILPVLGEVSADAPPDVAPVFEASSGHWYFPSTGSWVHLFGADDQRKADRGRGPKAFVAVFDEAGFTPVLQYVLSSVFRPAMLHGSRFTIVSSTPAPEPDHDFTRLCEMAEGNNALFQRDIYSNPLLTPEQIRKFIADDAKDNGMTPEEYVRTAHFQREYEAKRVTDKTLQVMGDDWEKARNGWVDPENTGHAIPAALVEHPRPQFFDAYECIDFGGVDPRAALFGFWDFEAATLVVEDEVNLRSNENTAQLADAVKAKESELYGVKAWDGTLRALRAEALDDRIRAFLPEEEFRKLKAKADAPLQPYIRIGDHDVQSVNDLWTLHGLAIIPADKGDLVARVNETRVALRQGRIRIHPRCRDLDRQLRTSEWTSPRATDFKRKAGEHADLLWCLITMWHNVRKGRNPAPPLHGITDPVDAMIRKRQAEAKGLRGLARAGIKRLG
jgi:hypothetical protein